MYLKSCRKHPCKILIALIIIINPFFLPHILFRNFYLFGSNKSFCGALMRNKNSTNYSFAHILLHPFLHSNNHNNNHIIMMTMINITRRWICFCGLVVHGNQYVLSIRDEHTTHLHSYTKIWIYIHNGNNHNVYFYDVFCSISFEWLLIFSETRRIFFPCWFFSRVHHQYFCGYSCIWTISQQGKLLGKK